jgi:GntR family transcriptional regulator of arabinose operon
MIKFQVSKTSALPLHIQLLDDLRHKIMTGALQPNDRLPGEWEIAEELEISRTTIQKAWQGAEEENLIYRVHGKGTFIAGMRAANTIRAAIGLVLPDFRSTASSHLMHAAERVFRRKGYRVQVAGSEYSIAEENRVLLEMQRDGLAGYIVWAVQSEKHDRLISELSQSTPTVLLDRPVSGLHLPCVTSNNYAGGMQAMSHLTDLGHRNIAFLARPHLQLMPVADRYRAYRDALYAIGETPAEPILIGNDEELSSYNAYLTDDDASLTPLVKRLRQPDRPSAIFAVNDWMAMRILRAATSIGLRVPEDLSLVGFDNLDISKSLTPPLTTVAQDSDVLGAEAARRLLDLIDGEPMREVFSLIPTQLMVRESTRPHN